MNNQWKDLLKNIPEGTTHVDLIFEGQLRRYNVDYANSSSLSNRCYRKSVLGEWYRYDRYKGKYSRAQLQGKMSPWRIINKIENTDYLISVESIKLLAKHFSKPEQENI